MIFNALENLDPDAIAWIDQGQPISNHEIAVGFSNFESLPKNALLVLEGFSPFETWRRLLWAWKEGLRTAVIPAKTSSLTLSIMLEQIPWDFLWSPLSLLPASNLCRVELRNAHPEAQHLIFSSGSTGVPKAIAHSLKGLLQSAQTSLEFYHFLPGDAWLLSLDLGHVGGLQIAIRTCLGRGICLYAAEPRALDQALIEYNPGFVSLVPTQLYRLMQNPSALRALATCKAILLGGASCSKELWLAAKEHGLKISICYGSTETASQLAAFLPGIFPDRVGEVGELLPGWTLEASAQPSRYLIRGSSLFLGIWQKKVWEPRSENFLLPDFAECHQNRLLIKGRSDAIVQVGGDNVSSGEILSALSYAYRTMDPVVVFWKDAEFGSFPLLVLRGPIKPDAARVLAELNQWLSPMKRPRALWWFDSEEVIKPSPLRYLQMLNGPSQSNEPSLHLLWAYER